MVVVIFGIFMVTSEVEYMDSVGVPSFLEFQGDIVVRSSLFLSLWTDTLFMVLYTLRLSNGLYA